MNEQIEVIISDGGLEASIIIPVLFDENGDQHIYSKEDVIAALSEHGVNAGYLYDEIDRLVNEKRYNTETICARGIAPVDGIDGYYEFLFDTVLDRKPKIRENGTADYWNIHLVEVVQKRQVIAIYHDPVQGKDGMSVTGEIVSARIGRELPPLAGRGFERMDNNHIYFSNMDGKIEYANNRIVIMPVYEIFGDVDMKTGNIEFRGDVIVHGNVRKGMKLFTTGTITIDGVVEASDIECKKDVLIRGGVHGGYESKIKTDGSFFAGFMEYASVESKGQIIAESILNCDVMCYDRILVANKNASIVGGKVYATAGIEVNILGNKNYVKTKIDAGLQANVVQEVVTLQSRVFEDQNTVKKTEKILKTLADKEYKDPHQNNKNPIKIDLLRTKVTKQAQIARDNARLEELNIILKKASDATIRINQEIYPGVDVAINNIRTKVSSHQKAVEFTECEKKLRMYSLEIR